MRVILLAAALALAGCAAPPSGPAYYQPQPVYQAPPPYLNPGYQMPINRTTTTNCQRYGSEVICTTR